MDKDKRHIGAESHFQSNLSHSDYYIDVSILNLFYYANRTPISRGASVVLKKRGQGQRECVEELDRLLPNSFLEKYLRGQISFRLWIT